MVQGGQDNKNPSIAELQRFVREKSKLEFLLNNGEKYIGTLRWFDDSCFCVVQEYEGPLTILRSAVAAYRQAKQ